MSITKALAKDEGEFRNSLEIMEVDVSENSPKAKRDDWTNRMNRGRMSVHVGQKTAKRSRHAPA